MDSQGNIYPLSDLSVDQIDKVEVKEDVARLDGYLRGRSEAARLSGARRHERMVYDIHENKHKPYVKEPTYVEHIGNDIPEPEDEGDDAA